MENKHKHDIYLSTIKIITNVLFAISLITIIVALFSSLGSQDGTTFTFIIAIIGLIFAWLVMQLFFGLLLDIKIIRDDVSKLVVKESTTYNQQNTSVPVATVTEIVNNTQSTQVVGSVKTNAKEQVQKETIVDNELGINVSQLDEHMKKVYDLYKKGYITKEQFEQELKK